MDDVMMMAGKRDQLSFADMREDERMIIKALERAAVEGTGALKIAELQAANGWDLVDEHKCSLRCEICAEALRRGNSKVRNNLRRLMRYGWIHRPIDGTYALITETTVEPAVEVQPEPPQPVVQLVVEPPQPVKRSEPPLVQIRKRPHPVELSEEVAMRMYVRAKNEDYTLVEKIKRPDCTFYGACLDQAIAGDWAGFSCADCTAYALPNRHQQEIDILGCLGVHKARELMEKYGKVMRVRGVKPGADARLPDDEETEDFAEVG